MRIDFKGKVRIILIPRSLLIILKDYCRKHKIKEGSIFRSRNGRPLDRRNIWAEMKSLCERAMVAASKVFPHNLRHLFARCFYEKERSLWLTDYLRHETTRQAMIWLEEACVKDLELGLVQREEGGSEGKKGNTEQIGKIEDPFTTWPCMYVTDPHLYLYIHNKSITKSHCFQWIFQDFCFFAFFYMISKKTCSF